MKRVSNKLFSFTKPRRRFAAALGSIAFALALGGAGLGACSPERSGPSVGSNSNWLRACVAQAECAGAPACVCGACTAACASDADCVALGNAHCALGNDPARDSVCGMDPTATGGICLPRCTAGSCGEGQACVQGACVLVSLPANAFCTAVDAASAADLTHADELLALLEDQRTQGALVCGTGLPRAAAPALRLDARLVCAARVFAEDLTQNHSTTETDSQGRSTEQRMLAAGYMSVQWGEAFALQMPSADGAFGIMRSDTNSCMRFSDPGFRDVGVASAGSSYVITLGSTR